MLVVYVCHPMKAWNGCSFIGGPSVWISVLVLVGLKWMYSARSVYGETDLNDTGIVWPQAFQTPENSTAQKVVHHF